MLSVSGDAHSQSIQLKLCSDPSNLATARKAIESLSRSCGFDEASGGELGLVINEAMANIIRHAYKGDTTRPISLEANFADCTLHIALRDWGNGANPAEKINRPHDPCCPGGIGLICMRQLMDGLEYIPQPDGMLLKMSRRIDRRAASVSARNVG